MNRHFNTAVSAARAVVPTTFRSLYDRECINIGVDGFINSNRAAIIQGLSRNMVQLEGFKASIRKALLKESLTKTDISNIATIISSTSLRGLFTKWIITMPVEFKKIQASNGSIVEQKIFQDLSRQVLRNVRAFHEWLLTLPEKISSDVSKFGGFVSGGIYFTPFGIFSPHNYNSIQFPGMMAPVTAKKLHEYDGKITRLQDGKSILQITRTDIRQNLTNKYYTQDGIEIIFKDTNGNTYKVKNITNDGIVQARIVVNGVSSSTLKYYKLHPLSIMIIPLDSTSTTSSS